MNKLLINGGRPLHGTIAAGGNKNAVLPMIAASLLTDAPVQLENVPEIGDVRTMCALARSLGVRTDWDAGNQRLVLQADGLRDSSMPPELCSKIRASILFAAPLLHRFGHAAMAPPGGDVIGRRRLDSHFHALEAAGATISLGPHYEFRAAHGLRGCDVFLPEASVTATAQVLLAAVRAEGTTVIRNAAAEPHIEDLTVLLNRMGGNIRGGGSNTVTVEGVPELAGTSHCVCSDHVEAGSFLALAAATGGDVTVTGVDPAHYRMITRVFEQLGIRLELDRDTVRVPAEQERRVQPELGGGIPVIDDGVWPQFPSDLMSMMIVLATQVTGTVLFFEKMYESRMYFVDRLVAMGANAVICDPHRVVIAGPAQLHGIELSSPDIRAGMALVGAALCARGQSLIRNVRLIDRGYQHIDRSLRSLGAAVERLDD